MNSQIIFNVANESETIEYESKAAKRAKTEHRSAASFEDEVIYRRNIQEKKEAFQARETWKAKIDADTERVRKELVSALMGKEAASAVFGEQVFKEYSTFVANL